MSERTRAIVGFYTLALALALSALAAGAVHLPVLLGVSALVLVSALVCVGRDTGRRELGLSAVWLGLALYCLLQALPLPLSWLAHLSPEAADIWARSLRGFGLGAPELGSVSLAPGRSVLEGAKAATYALVISVAADQARRFGFARVLLVVFGVGVLVALVTTAHDVARAERLYGVYRPLEAFEIAPLLNPNNRAGFLTLAFFSGVGILTRTQDTGARAALAVALSLMLAQLLLCRSRGGTAALILGSCLLLALSLGSRRRAGVERRSALGWVLASTLAATLLSIVALGDEGYGRLLSTSTEKLDLLAGAAELALAHPFFGVGRGAFGTVFPAYQREGGHAVFEHAENFVLQWASEWGWPVCLMALALATLAARGLFSRRARARTARRAALVGLGALLAQNLVDLGLEVPAVALAFSAVLGALLGQVHAAHEQPDARALERRTLWLRWAASTTIVGSLALALALGGGRSPASERHALHRALEAAGGAPSPSFWLALREAHGRLPADPYLPLLGASAALAEGGDALRFAARAIERAPKSAQAHLVLARALHAKGARSQALGVFARATALAPTQTRGALETARALALTPDELEAALPPGAAAVPLARELALGASPAQRERWLTLWLARAPSDTEAHGHAARALLGALERGGNARCGDRAACLTRVEQHLLALPAGAPATEIGWARWLALAGKPEQAEKRLQAACSAAPRDVDCALALVDLATKNDSAGLERALDALIATACTSPRACARVHQLLADRHAAAGRWVAALDHYQRAIGEAPEPGVLRAAARAAEALGRPAQAESLRRRAEEIAGPGGG